MNVMKWKLVVSLGNRRVEEGPRTESARKIAATPQNLLESSIGSGKKL